MAVTLKDVARLAEADVGSVSRTLSGHPRAQQLRPETRERILDAARKLGYRRNIFAAAMRSKINHTVAVINTAGHIRMSPSALRVLSGIIQGASDAGYALKTYNDSDPASVIEDILANQIRHVLCMTPLHDKREQIALLCLQNDLKLVYVYETAHGKFPAVSPDNFNVSRKVVRYLAEMGHRRIALICGEYQKWHYMTEKYNGYLAALKERGIMPRFEWMTCCVNPMNDIQVMLSLPAPERPTAFFCIGDGFAMRVQNSAIRMGLRVPEDVSMAGFGNEADQEDSLVPLSSVDEEHDRIGEEAFRLLINGQSDLACDPDGTYRYPGKFICRSSVADLN